MAVPSRAAGLKLDQLCLGGPHDGISTAWLIAFWAAREKPKRPQHHRTEKAYAKFRRAWACVAEDQQGSSSYILLKSKVVTWRCVSIFRVQDYNAGPRATNQSALALKRHHVTIACTLRSLKFGPLHSTVDPCGMLHAA